MTRSSVVFWSGTAALFFRAGTPRAEVVEPNGVVVPGYTNSDPTSTEKSLQTYFDEVGEPIDALADASAEPGVFSPLCDFEIAFVLGESQGPAGIAWYNAPADPNAAPATFFELVPQGTPVGTVVASADIRSNAAYEGGLIGFVLVRDMPPNPVYYSEFRRNVLCTGCTTPDHWKMAVAYPSTLFANSYYLGFEDWPGADQNTWQGNDGDMNDKVFRISGVVCAGGGDPCDTGLPGVCGAGRTDCAAVGTAPECRQSVEPADEACDNLDNDCDGVVDEGDFCPESQVCVRGRCVGACGVNGVVCNATQECNAEGFCVEPDCLDVTCEAGEVCRGGDCIEGCQGVTCPLGQVCQLGACVDLCANVTCELDRVCESGACVQSCGCRPCPEGTACADSGLCVPAGCESLTCGAGEACVAGACVDACEGAVCPNGEACEAGSCLGGEEPMTGTGGASGSTGGAPGAGTGGLGLIAPPAGTSGASGTSRGGSTATAGGSTAQNGGASGTVGGGSNPERGGSGGVSGSSTANGGVNASSGGASGSGAANGGGTTSGKDEGGGCQCRVGGAPRGGELALGLALGGLALVVGRRRRRGVRQLARPP